MPEWMEPYRDSIVNTGGNTIERLMDVYYNDSNVLSINMPLGVLAISCSSQVALLTRLRKDGVLDG